MLSNSLFLQKGFSHLTKSLIKHKCTKYETTSYFIEFDGITSILLM